MSDHRLEKQVGQKLDDLKLTPSVHSWENIERELKKDKRRPAPVFWLPLLMLGLGALGYFIFRSDESKAIPVENHPSVLQDSRAPREILPAPGEGAVKIRKSVETSGFEETNLSTKKQDAEQHKPLDITSPLYQRPSLAANDIINKTVVTSPVDQLKITVPAHPSPGRSPGLLPPAGNKSPLTTKDLKERSISINNQADTGLAGTQNLTHNAMPAKSGIGLFTEVNKGIEKATPMERQGEKAEPATKPATAPNQQKKRLKKWSFGINAFGGIASLSEGKLGFSNAVIATVSENRQPLSLASPAVLPPAASPSRIYPGLSFGLGLTTKYQLSKRLSISTAVNYLQINTICKVGYKLEQSNYTVSNMNATGADVMYLPPAGEQQRDYDNKYHFIEIPVNLHTRVNKSEKLPLFWNAGFSVSKLIKSNSLHYDALQYYYYSDDNLLKKTQAAVSTGFSFVVFNKTSRPLWIGPTVRYNISKALSQEVSPNNKHFMGAGLDVKWFLK